MDFEIKLLAECKLILMKTLMPPLWPHGYRVRLFTYCYGHSVREVAGLCLSCGTIVEGVFHTTGKVFSTKHAIYSKFMYR